MADEENKVQEVPEPTRPGVVAQEAKLVGDDEMPEVRRVQVDVNEESVAAQVAQPREGDSDTVQVHETSVSLDEVITDPSSPLAVQVPDAGRGTMSLPIHELAQGTVEDYFREHAAESDDSE